MSEIEKPFKVPDRWTWTTFDEIGVWSGGGTPSKSKSTYWDGMIPWVSPKDMKTHAIQDTEDHVTPTAVQESSAKHVPSDSILFVTRSGILQHTLPTAIATVDLTVNQDLKALTPVPSVDSKFVLYYTVAANRHILHACSKSGTTVQSIQSSQLYQYPIPLPSITEQRRIVAKIEELFSNLDAGMADLQTAQHQLERYRLSVLQAAVEGRLTAAWRRTHAPEPADALLGRILEAHRESWEQNYRAKYERKERDLPNRWKSRYSAPDPGDTSDHPELPEGWTWVRFDCLLSEKLRNGKSAKTAKDGNGVRVLTLSAVTDGEFTLENTKIGQFDPEKVEDLWLEPGDLLIERSNTAELVGTTRLYDGEKNFAIYPDLVIRARVTEVLLDKYAELALQSHRSHSFLREKARGTSGSMQKINQSIIGDVLIPVPPLDEQEQIIAEVERLLSVADDAAATVEREHMRAERLRQSILKQAFSGQLVPHEGGTAPAPAPSGNGTPRTGEQIELGL